MTWTYYVRSNWNQAKGFLQEKWGELTNDDLERIKGSREKLVGKLQEYYSLTADEAKKQVDEWQKNFEKGWSKAYDNWEKLKDNISQQWDKLTKDQLDEIGGERSELIYQLQKVYNISEEEARQQVDEWEEKLSSAFKKENA